MNNIARLALIPCALACTLAAQHSFAQYEKVPEPRIVGSPPADGSRGLVRVNGTEIRHYSGTRKEPDYLVSKDNGETWEMKMAPDSYPKNFGGIPKESPAITRNPITKEFIRVQPINGFVFISEGGLDGKWAAVTKKGKLEYDWNDDEKRKDLVTLGGIMRNPVFVNKGTRILVPYHNMRGGSKFHISDDGGLTWKQSKDGLTSPPHEKKAPHQGVRWYNNAVETTVVELKDGTLWALARTSQDQAYEAYSKDYGNTWSKSKPSRFFGTLTMNTLGKLSDGTLVSLWTNTMAMPESQKPQSDMWEDVFTNRDAHHIAMSTDEGKTWFGFREIILDEHRNAENYATMNGAEDRAKHQSEFVQLDPNRILISLGQHPEHRKLVIVDKRWVAQKSRATQTGENIDQWTIHTFIPQIKGHSSYNRKASAELVSDPENSGRKVLQIKRLDDESLVNKEFNVDYQNGGATWNFPNGTSGEVKFRVRIADGDQADDSGLQVSLTDRLFNAPDTTTRDYAMFTFPIKLGSKPMIDLGTARAPFTPGKWHDVTIQWANDRARVIMDGKLVGMLNMANKTPNGVSYIHFISTATKPDSGFLIDTVEAKVK